MGVLARRLTPGGLSGSFVGWAVSVVVAGAGLGLATALSLQAALTVVVVAIIGVVHVRAPHAGLVLLWFLWLMTPFARRLFDLLETTDQLDILALCPFLATVLVATLEFERHRVSRRGGLVLMTAVLGLVLAVPAGWGDPLLTVAAFTVYMSGVVAFMIGYSEQARTGAARSLERALLLAVPVVAAYGIYQTLSPLPVWDVRWLDTIDIASFGSKDPDSATAFRAFSTLNSPGTLAVVLSVFLATVLVAPRLTPNRIIAGLLALLCLAFTLVRSAWIAVLVAVLLVLLLERGRHGSRLLALAGILATLVLAADVTGGPLAEVVERGTTLRTIDEDRSAQAREETVSAFLPSAISAPLGHGLGAVGDQLRQLSGVRPKAFPDNGYLATLYQLGPPGTVLFLGSLIGALAWGFSRTRRSPRRAAGVRLAVIAAMLLALHVSSDILFGLPGAMLWYVAGALLALGEASAGPSRSRVGGVVRAPGAAMTARAR